MQSLRQDLRYAIRLLLRRPGFAFMIIAMLALGIGANSAIFSVVNAVLLKPLPYAEPGRLVMLWGRLPTHGLDQLNLSPPEFVDFRERNATLADIAAYASIGRNLTGAGEPERITATLVSSGFFSVLGISPLRGRTFSEEDDKPGHNQAVLLSYNLWQSRFGGDDNVVGQNLSLDGRNCTVIGIMPASFRFPDAETQVWKPMGFDADDLSENNRGSHYLSVIARMKPVTSLAGTQADLTAIAGRLQEEHPEHYEPGSGWGVTAVRLQDQLVGDVRTPLLVLLGAVGLLLLIACVNVANLLLAHAASRQREIAIRVAVGAGRWRIIRQLLAESLVLASAGGALGLLIAMWGKDLLVALGAASLPRLAEVRIDAQVLMFTLGASLLTAMVFGVVPAMQCSKLNLSDSLKAAASSTTEARGRRRFRGALVAAEIALALVLTAGAGLLIRSMYRLNQVDAGFDSSNLLTMRLSLPQAKYAAPQQQRAFFDGLAGKVAALPSVTAVGVVNFLPFSGTGNRRNISVEGKPENPINVEFRICNADYFRAMRIETRAGRLFDDSDRDNSTYVVVVNETFARVFLPDEDPLGKRVKMGGPGTPFRWLSIVGVVKDLKQRGLESETRPEMYVPYLQPPLPDWNVQSMFLAVRGGDRPQPLAAAIRAAVADIDPEQPIFDVATMRQRIGDSVGPRRFNTILMAAFAALALMLAAVGVYGVIADFVTQRTREIGIRMALGARAPDVFAMIVGLGLRLILGGLLIGVPAALGLTRLMRNLLFGVGPADLLTFAAVAVLLTAVALIACYVPARRATRVAPMVALRYE